MAGITINDKPLSDYGAEMLAGSYNSLLKPAQLKPWVSNEPINGNGVQYIIPETEEVFVAERQVDLIFSVIGDTKEAFLANYRNFIALLQSGMLDFHIPDLGRHYYLKYENCTSFDHIALLACKVAVKFSEPNPKKESE